MKTILCYGDSNTWGYHAKADTRFQWKERYPGILSALMGEEYHVVENGLCGRTTRYDSEIEPFVNGLQEASVCAAVNEPISYAVIMLGTNDCKDMYEVSPWEIGEGVRAVGKCLEKTGAQILLIAPAAMRNLKDSPFLAEFGEHAEEKSLQLKNVYMKIAREEGWLFLDADVIVSPGEFDRIHLEKEGHEKLAVSISGIIRDKEAEE